MKPLAARVFARLLTTPSTVALPLSPPPHPSRTINLALNVSPRRRTAQAIRASFLATATLAATRRAWPIHKSLGSP
jgi:hypothetical protein